MGDTGEEGLIFACCCRCVSIFSNSMFAGGAPVLKQLLQLFVPLRWFPYLSFGGCRAVDGLVGCRVATACALVCKREEGVGYSFCSVSRPASELQLQGQDLALMLLFAVPLSHARAVRYALEALYVGEVVEYKQLFQIQVPGIALCVLTRLQQRVLPSFVWFACFSQRVF